MNILIAGGTGFIGSYIKKRFEENGDTVRVAAREGGDVSWDEADLTRALEKTDVLVNLAGKSINCRFTEKNKQAILKSRIETTRRLNNALGKCINRPKLWINASAAGIYKHTFNEVQDEYAAAYGDDFLAEVVTKWEAEFYSVTFPETRKIALRTTVVLGKSGGVYPLLNRLSRFGLGGKQGSGKQMFSWIYVEDYFRILQFVIKEKTVEGAVNAAAPNPVTNKALMRAFKKTNKALLAVPSPEFLLQMSSYVLNFQPDLVLDSVNVSSRKLKELNFEFQADDIETALLKIKLNFMECK